jgi:hypothetical protein
MSGAENESQGLQGTDPALLAQNRVALLKKAIADAEHRSAPPHPTARETAANSAPAPATTARGPFNILVVLPGDFGSNSALHVVALTRHLAAERHRFVVVADHRFSNLTEPPLAALATYGEVSFTACTYDEAIVRLPAFPDGRGPDIVHAWTTRDNVRKLCEPVVAASGASLIVHLEDNEAQILSNTLGRSIEELRNLTPAEADALLPWNLSHPGVAERFLASAAAATLVIDRLAEFLPPEMPSLTFWPAADERYFFPRPRPGALRESLGFDAGHTVLF